MEKIVFVNTVCYGSTGRICKTLYTMAQQKGYSCYIAYGRGKAEATYKTIKIGTIFDVLWHVGKARFLGKNGFGSYFATKRFIKKLERLQPDILHLHNLHGYYLNLPLFCAYLKRHPEIKKIWTLHDCWSFTGNCAHYNGHGCMQWQSQCRQCQHHDGYPKTIKSDMTRSFQKKKACFTGIENLILITPSDWLLQQVQASFLQAYPIYTIHNGIDLQVFSPRKTARDKKTKTILGVAGKWTAAKGFDDFIALAKHIPDAYQIVMIGLTKQQLHQLPSNIKGYKETHDVKELVSWYQQSYVFFNPTYEDTYPSVNLEAQACGCPIVSYDVGGCKETLCKGSYVVHNVNEFLKLLKEKPLQRIQLLPEEKAHLDKNRAFLAYITLYEGRLHEDGKDTI